MEMVPPSSLLWRVRSPLNPDESCIVSKNDLRLFPPRILCWWGIWTLTISPSTNGTLPSSAKAAQYGAVVSPLFTMLYVQYPILPYCDVTCKHTRTAYFSSSRVSPQQRSPKRVAYISVAMRTHGRPIARTSTRHPS